MEIIRNRDGFSVSLAGNVLFSHSRGRSLLKCGKGEHRIGMYRGNFEVEDLSLDLVELSDWEELEPEGPGTFRVRFHRGDLYPVVAVFSSDADTLTVAFAAGDTAANRFVLRVDSLPGEHVYGCGEQFSHFDLRGRAFPLWTSEQGVGRNKLTEITRLADMHDKAGGDYWWTFFPEPSFMTSRRYFLHADTRSYAEFDFTREDRHELLFWEVPRTVKVLSSDTFPGLASAVSNLLGRQPEPPDWIHDGIVLGIQGGTETCRQKTRHARSLGVKVAGIWAQDWEGKRITSFGKRLMWDWKWDPELYPGLDAEIAAFEADGVRFLGYINPYVARGKSLCVEAEKSGFLAKTSQGGTYYVDFAEFEAGIVDFTNPAAFEWYKGVIKKNMIAFGLAGWMADFGEYLPHDVVLHDGTPGMLAHNEWPAIWARVNYEALCETGTLDKITYFMRAGYAGSQKHCVMMWAGDQNVDWSEDDGLPSVITSALSLATCGHGLHHSDIGGYTTLFGMKRTKELFMRWAELAAFTTFMRTHEGNRPDDNWQFDSDEGTLLHLARMTRLFVSLKPYRKALCSDNAKEGIPVMRPLFFHYGDDARAFTVKDQFLLGRDILVAPVIAQGGAGRAVWLPGDSWIHAWSGKTHSGGTVDIDAPLGYPPAFVRGNSPLRDSVLAAFSYV